MKQVIAPAKVNLFLHVLGKNKNNYHQLQSIVSFADFGDVITIDESDDYNLEIGGEFGSLVSTKNNLITLAVKALSEFAGKNPNVNVHLQKNIPVGAGLGGGSADAAAIIRALLDIWDIEVDYENLHPLLTKLGADVPMCFTNQTSFIEGIGEIITPVDIPQPLHTVFIYPHVNTNTTKVFSNFNQKYSNAVTPILEVNIWDYLNSQHNDLTDAAVKLHPEIQEVLNALNQQASSKIVRMSGSGSCCFALFDNQENAKQACTKLSQENPDWWIKQTVLNSN